MGSVRLMEFAEQAPRPRDGDLVEVRDSNRPRRLYARVMVAALCCVLLASLSSCSDAESSTPTDTRSVTLGVSKEALSALAYVARDNEIFEQYGLDVEIVEYPSSQAVVDALVTGEIDAALSADTQIVFAAMDGQPVRIIGTIGSDSNPFQIVGRSDVGIANPGDLRGKRIGTGMGTASSFFLHVFLVKHGIADSDVDIRYGTIEEEAASLLAGDLDAMSIREPITSQLREALDDRFVVFEDDGLLVKSMNLCVSSGADAPVQEVQRRLLQAFIAAEAYGVADITGTVERQVADAIGIETEDLHSYVISEGAVRLDQSLLLSLEDQARWATATGLTSGDAPLDTLGIVDTRPMMAVAPDRVSVIE